MGISLNISSVLEDTENCLTLAIKAHEVERFDHVLHYLKVCRKHVRNVNEQLEQMLSKQVGDDGCGHTRPKPSVDDYDRVGL